MFFFFDALKKLTPVFIATLKRHQEGLTNTSWSSKCFYKMQEFINIHLLLDTLLPPCSLMAASLLPFLHYPAARQWAVSARDRVDCLMAKEDT